MGGGVRERERDVCMITNYTRGICCMTGGERECVCVSGGGGVYRR